MCVGPFQDRTAKRQIKGWLKSQQGYMSNGGFGLSGREGLALPGRLEFRERNTTRETKKNGKREWERDKKAKQWLKTQKRTNIRTWHKEDP